MIEMLEKKKNFVQENSNIDYLVEEAVRLSKLEKDKTAKEHIKDLEEILAELDEKAKQYPEYADDIAFEKKYCLESIEDWQKIAAEEEKFNEPYDYSDDYFWKVQDSLYELEYVEKKHPELKSNIDELWQALIKLKKDYKALTQPQAITA